MMNVINNEVGSGMGEMSFIGGLINTLKEWEELSISEDTDLRLLVSYALRQLGSKNDIFNDDYEEQFLYYLTARIKVLEKEGVFEDFLVYGVLKIFDDYFIGQLENHGSYLINNDFFYGQVVDEDSESGPSNREEIEYCTSHKYILDKENELDVWNLVKTKHFNKSNIREWSLRLNKRMNSKK